MPGQNALEVNGTLTIPKGASLTAKGGGDIIYAPLGGHGIVLNNGTINGDGTLISYGGIGYNGDGGNGIYGNGTISVGYLVSVGGDSKSLWNDETKGGDAVDSNIKFNVKDYALTGGKGNPSGSNTFTPSENDPETAIDYDKKKENITDAKTTPKEGVVMGTMSNDNNETDTTSKTGIQLPKTGLGYLNIFAYSLLLIGVVIGVRHYFRKN